MKNFVWILTFVFISCTNAQDKTQFSEKALADVLLTLDGEQKPFSEIISQYKGKNVVIDVWASWCHDCIEGMPKVKEIQEKYTQNTVYLFLSLDRNEKAWKRGIERYNVKGEHYLLTSGWKGDFCKSIKLDWIPRYMIVNPEGKIQFWKAKKATSRKFAKALEKMNSK